MSDETRFDIHVNFPLDVFESVVVALESSVRE